MPDNPVVPDQVAANLVALRRVLPSDDAALHEVFSSNEAMMSWELAPARTIDDTRAWITRSRETGTAWHAAWSVLDLATKRVVGVVTYHSREPWQDRTQVSFAFIPARSATDLLCEALAALLTTCFVELKSHRLDALINPSDQRSKAVLEALGFSFEGILRERFRLGNFYQDMASYSILSHEWKPSASEDQLARDTSELFWRLPAEEAMHHSARTVAVPASGPWHYSLTPVVLAFGVKLGGDRLRGWHLGRLVSVYAPNRVLRVVVEAADGYHTVDQIASRASKEFDRRDVLGLLSEMMANGIIVPCDRYMEEQWNWVRNPPFFSREIPEGLPHRLTKGASDRVAVLSSTSFEIKPVRDQFTELIQSRSTTRAFGPDALSDAQVSTLLYAAYGVLDQRKPDGNHGGLARRVVPSAGGIYPLLLTWAQWRSTELLSDGIYRIHFGPNRSVGFERLAKATDEVFRGLLDPLAVSLGHGILFISADFRLSASKYGNRAIPYCLLEAGHLAQNLNVSADLMGLGTCETGGFIEERVKRLTELPDCEPVLGLVVGAKEKDDVVGQPVVAAELEFSWIDFAETYRPSFHLCQARLRTSGHVTDWCWGRSDNPLLAAKKAASEGVERLACQLPRELNWATALSIGSFVDPRRFVAYPRSRYSSPGFQLYPFKPDELHAWVNAVNVLDYASSWVLADHVYFQGSIVGPHSGRPYTSSSTSGVAAFPTLEGALERAFLETIERHAFMVTWLGYNSPQILKDSSLPEDLRDTIENLNASGWKVTILILDAEPSISVLAFSQHEAYGMTRVAAASRFHAHEAIEHALQELEASIAFIAEKNRGPLLLPRQVQSPHDHGSLYLQRRYFRKADWLLENREVIEFGSLDNSCHTVEGLASFFLARGLQSYFIDMTPDIRYPAGIPAGLKVVRVLVEGLVPISFGYRLEPCLTPWTYGNKPAVRPPQRRFPHPFY